MSPRLRRFLASPFVRDVKDAAFLATVIVLASLTLLGAWELGHLIP